MTDNAPKDEVGSLADEAAKLFAVAADWAREHTEGSAASGGGPGARLRDGLSDEHIATGASECRWCPVCQAIGLLRSTSPDVKEHVASLVVVARQLLDSVADAVADDGKSGGGGPSRSGPPDVEHIDLSEDDSWD